MKNLNKLIASFLFIGSLSFANAQQTSNGVGVRLGSLSGLSYKHYMGSNAIEISIGRSHGFVSNGYYNSRFNTWYNDKKFDYAEYDYRGFSASNPIGIQARYLFHKPISHLGDLSTPGLSWYYGIGGQLRFQTYKYLYRYRVNAGDNWVIAEDRVTDIDIGADLILGTEYTFQEVPISIFLDINLFVEVIDNPFALWFQSGIGARYNF